MLFRALDQFSFDPLGAIINLASFAVALIIGITVHEFSHALAATRLGDYTAQRLGRLTLNPRAHLDPLGTILIFFAGFGWGKPTPVTASNLRIGQRAGMAVVSLAGPISNVLVAAIVALPVRMGMESVFLSGILGAFIVSLVTWNLVLAVFNLIPIAPLDGFKMLLGILPRDLANSFAKSERYGPVILMLLIMSGFIPFLGGLNIFSRIISPVVSLSRSFILGL